MITVTDGKHKGKTGSIVSRTDFYATIRMEDGVLIRCKSSFTKEIEPTIEEDDILEQMLLESIEYEKNEKLKKNAQQNSAMIQDQKREYEESLKQDIENAKQVKFEEVSLEEMRRVRLLRFSKP